MSDEDEKFVNKMAGGGDPNKVPADAQAKTGEEPLGSAGGGDPNKVPSNPPPKKESNTGEGI